MTISRRAAEPVRVVEPGRDLGSDADGVGDGKLLLAGEPVAERAHASVVGRG
jgi:hypothetical protein